MSRRYVFTAIVFVLWIVGFYLAGSMSGIDLFAKVLEASPGSIVLGIGFYLVSIGTGIFILRRCLRFVGEKPPAAAVAKGWLFGAFIDNVSPTVAPLGQVAIAYFLERFYNIKYSKSLAAIGVYVTSWGIAAGIFSACAIMITQAFVGIPEQYLAFVLFTLSFFTVSIVIWFLLLTNKGVIKKIVHRFVSPYNKVYNRFRKNKVTFDPQVYDVEFERSYASLDIVMKSKTLLLSSIAFFWIPQTGQALCLYFMVLGFGVQVPFLGLLMVHIVSSMIGMLSIIPSGLFVYEAAVVNLSAVVAPGAGEVMLASVMLYRLIFVWMTNLLGGAIGIMQGIKAIGGAGAADGSGAK